jgi:glucose-fructose oxidoreductase
MSRRFRVVGIQFDHMHMGDLLRMAHEHPQAEITAVCDLRPERMAEAVARFRLRPEQVFTDPEACLAATRPDLVLLCPATAGHAEWLERVAPCGAAILMEKPFAASLADADRMLRALRPGQRFAVNWPLRWYPCHQTAHRLIREGRIGAVREVHFYDGNRGPLYHGAEKIEREPAPGEKDASWWYKRAAGGGSLLDYLGYGVTLGAWFDGGRVPVEVTSVAGGHPELEVDEHSVTICRHADGTLSTFVTRWGTLSDPWTHQPLPKCGFQIVGESGAIASYDLEPSVRLVTRARPEGEDIPAPPPPPPWQNPVQYLLRCLEEGRPLDGPLAPALSRLGQRMVEAAVRSLAERRTVPLPE